jgi:O-methyltransferase domain
MQQAAAVSLPAEAPATQSAPHRELIAIAAGIWKARALYAAAQLGLADLIGGGTATAQELARKTGTHQPSLVRLMRALGSFGIVTEPEPLHYRLTQLGLALRRTAPASAHAAILTLAGDWQWRAWEHMLHSVRTGEPAMRAAFGNDLFDYLDAHPDSADRFNAAMVGIHGGDGLDILAAYDFSGLRSIADIGGGTGVLLTTILQSNPHLRGLLFEQAQTLPEAKSLIADRGLASRCEALAGDFFRAIPPGHDAYILSHVLHDWTDTQALAILRNCREAIVARGRLLIVEAVLPAGDTPHPGKMMDLLMLTVTGGLERTKQEYAELLAQAGFHVTRVIPLASDQSIVEAIPS